MLAEGALIFLLNGNISENNKDAVQLHNNVIYTFPKHTTYLIKNNKEPIKNVKLPRKFNFEEIYYNNSKEK